MRPGPLLSLLLIAPALAACAGASPDTTPTHEASGEPVVWDAVVARSVGSAAAQVGDDCQVEVTPMQGAYFNCRVRVSCRSEVLYGLPGAGYNTCLMEDGAPRRARDGNGTRRDGDPKMFLDMERGEVVVSDRDPDMELVLAIESNVPPSGARPEPPPGYGPAPDEGR